MKGCFSVSFLPSFSLFALRPKEAVSTVQYILYIHTYTDRYLCEARDQRQKQRASTSLTRICIIPYYYSFLFFFFFPKQFISIIFFPFCSFLILFSKIPPLIDIQFSS